MNFNSVRTELVVIVENGQLFRVSADELRQIASEGKSREVFA